MSEQAKKLADQAKPTLVDPAGTPAESVPAAVPSATDIFNDLDALREQSKMTVRRRSVLVNVFVVKHPANNKYFRIHPEERMSLNATVTWDDRTCYFVTPGMRNHPKLITRLRYVTLFTVVQWPEQQPVIWPVPVELPGHDIAAWRSYRKAAELARAEWVQMDWREQVRDFHVEPAEGISVQPQWPKENFSDLLICLMSWRQLLIGPMHSFVGVIWPRPRAWSASAYRSIVIA
jgi:hypothetical protein